MYTEVSSFQERGSTVYRSVHISEGWNREVPLYIEVSSFQGGWNREVPLYTEVSSFQGEGFTVYSGVLISGGL